MDFFSNFLVVLLGTLISVLLVIQIYVLARVRRAFLQIGQFTKLMNVVFKEMSGLYSQSISVSTANQSLLKSLQRGTVRSNKKSTCQNCKHRLSFIKLDPTTLSFEYQCELSQKAIALEETCTKYEADVESPHASNL